jgi:putative DNA primase/helicase
VADGLDNAGLMHAFSGTCAIDIDDLDAARAWLAERGIDLLALLDADDAVQIVRGDASRGKLLYALAQPLPSKMIKSEDKTHVVLEFRCGASTGNTQQDLLPPSRHPSGVQYQWKYNSEFVDWRNLPLLPKSLHDLWLSMIAPKVERTAAELQPRAQVNELRRLLAQEDPDLAYDEWIKVGMALHHETGGSEEGLAIWNEWSSGGSKYKGLEELQYKWNSFHGNHPNPVTLGSLLQNRRACDSEFQTLRDDERPVIWLDGGLLAENATRCEWILSDEVYVRDHALVRIGAARELDPTNAQEIRRVDAQPIVMQLSVEYIQRRLTERVRFERYDARSKQYLPKDCPKGLASAIAKYGEWLMMRELRAIATAPFIRPDLTVCAEPGYDECSRTFYAPNAAFPALPEHPTRAEAQVALSTLLAPFAEFPFADPAHKAAFAAHLLTEAVRPAVDTVPLFVYTAPEAGTGKSLLSEMPACIVHGMPPAMRAWSGDGEELRKVLFASLLAGDRTIGFDNVPSGSKIYAAELCRFVTSITYSDRKLGVSETASMPNTAVAFLTGNNLTPAGDLARRSIVVRLDANVDSRALRERAFTIDDLRSYVRAQRAELLVAALTVVRAFVVAGAPRQAKPLPSFEQWAGLVRDPLAWLGLADPLVTQDQETDNGSEPLSAAFEAISRWRGDQWFQSSELHAQALWDESIHDALVAASCNVNDARHIGMWLSGHRGRKVNDVKLEGATVTRDGRGGVRGWRLAGADALDLL